MVHLHLTLTNHSRSLETIYELEHVIIEVQNLRSGLLLKTYQWDPKEALNSTSPALRSNA